MREGGKAAAGGCSELDIYRIPPYCRLCCNDEGLVNVNDEQ